MKEQILSREEVKALYSKHFANPYDLLPRHVEAFAAAIESALLKKLCGEPVAEIMSWANGSYHRNYRIEWKRDVDAGTQLYALNRSKA